MSNGHIYGNIAPVKTTVDLEAGLFKTARKLAIDQGRPFRAVLNDALRAYLGAGAAGAASAPPRTRRQAPSAAPAAPTRAAPTPEAEYWAIVNDRSRWDEMFGDRLQKIEDDIARVSAEWEKRKLTGPASNEGHG
jgi:hypothetical protein